jgi:hypothetical protein
MGIAPPIIPRRLEDPPARGQVQGGFDARTGEPGLEGLVAFGKIGDIAKALQACINEGPPSHGRWSRTVTVGEALAASVFG